MVNYKLSKYTEKTLKKKTISQSLDNKAEQILTNHLN